MLKPQRDRWQERRKDIALRPGPKPRLNKQRLEMKEDKDYAEVVLYGDTHWGSPQCDRERAKRMIDYCIEKDVYVLLMGDLLEFATKRSVGAGVYKQTMNPQRQYDQMIALLKPLAEKDKILGLLRGNHELRGYKESGINISEIMASELDCPYMGDACWNLWYVNGESYVLYTLHGATGSHYIHTKLNAAIKVAQNFDAEVVAMGHVHELASTAVTYQRIDKRNKQISEEKKFILLTGHYLNYDDSYAQRKGMTIGKEGSPKLKLFGNKHDIHTSK